MLNELYVPVLLTADIVAPVIAVPLFLTSPTHVELAEVDIEMCFIIPSYGIIIGVVLYGTPSPLLRYTLFTPPPDLAPAKVSVTILSIECLADQISEDDVPPSLNILPDDTTELVVESTISI